MSIEDDLPLAPFEFDSSAPGTVEGHCEFCHRKIWIDTEHYALAHELPMCPDFIALDVLPFLKANRERREAREARAPKA